MPSKQDDETVVEPAELPEVVLVLADNLSEADPDGLPFRAAKHTPFDDLPDWLQVRVIDNPLLMRKARRVVTVHYEVIEE